MVAISRLPAFLGTIAGSTLVALNASGMDGRAPASALPISAAVAEALEDIRKDVFGGGYFRAIQLLDDDELAEVYDSSGAGGRDLATKIQNELNTRYLLGGSAQTGAGGHGVWCDFDVGTWTISSLQLSPGMTANGLGDRFEVRFKQPADAQAPVIDVLGRGQNQDVIGRRTAVHLYRLDLNANGNLDANGDPINCVNLRVDPDNEGDDESANRTGLIAEEVQCGGASGWGIYNLKRGKLWLSKVQCTGNGLAPLLPNNKVGGLFSQGPDCFFHKVYCGNNGGPQMHIKSSATPSIVEIELGVSKQPDLYPSLYIENCTDMMVGGGGNCTGWIFIEGQEDDVTANEYDTETRINLYDFGMTLKNKSFQRANGTFFTMPGAIQLKNVRGVNIDNVRVKPATDDDIAVHHYTYRPTYLVHINGARSRATWRGPLPPLDDWNWPAGTPEVYAGPPTNTYDSITNKPDQLLIQTTDSTDATHAHLFDRIRGLYGTLPLDGVVEQDGASLVPKKTMTTEINVKKARNDVTLGSAATWTFSNATPANGTICGVTCKATGANRVVTLPASIKDLSTGSAVASFTVLQNHTQFINFLYIDAVWYIAGYPIVDPLANANLGDYADDAAAAAGGVAVDGYYRTGSIVKKRIA